MDNVKITLRWILLDPGILPLLAPPVLQLAVQQGNWTYLDNGLIFITVAGNEPDLFDFLEEAKGSHCIVWLSDIILQWQRDPADIVSMLRIHG